MLDKGGRAVEVCYIMTRRLTSYLSSLQLASLGARRRTIVEELRAQEAKPNKMMEKVRPATPSGLLLPY
jgi:hypothetical protein